MGSITAIYFEGGEIMVTNEDAINPKHYTQIKIIECIEITEQFNFCRGNAIKYIWRAGLKSKDTEIQDLRKAAWYIDREIKRLQEIENIKLGDDSIDNI